MPVPVTVPSWPIRFFPRKPSHRTANWREERAWKNNTEKMLSSHIMLAHSPEVCKNAASSSKKGITGEGIVQDSKFLHGSNM